MCSDTDFHQNFVIARLNYQTHKQPSEVNNSPGSQFDIFDYNVK